MEGQHRPIRLGPLFAGGVSGLAGHILGNMARFTSVAARGFGGKKSALTHRSGDGRNDDPAWRNRGFQPDSRECQRRLRQQIALARKSDVWPEHLIKYREEE